MELSNQNRTVLSLSFPLIILIIIVSYAGIFIQGTYSKETANWTAQALGQDIIDLFLVTPFLLFTSWFSYKDNKFALMLWGGGMVFVIYTFLIYCFALHFNYLFALYCFILGLSFYSFLYFLLSQNKQPVTVWFDGDIPAKTTGILFIVTSCLFYFLWLSEIIPSMIINSVPKTVLETGLFTNPVHVIDLALLLPGAFVVGILLLKKKPLGLLLAPVLLVFFILMSITIGTLIIVMKAKGIEAEYSIAVIFFILAFIYIVLLVRYLKNFRGDF